MTSAGGLLAGAATLVWAFFWPDTGCSEPACARKRFAIAVELDAFEQVDPIELDVTVDDKRIGLSSIFASGGVGAALVADQADLPYKAASGALDRADLYQFTTAWRNAQGRGDVDASIYALLAPALVSGSCRYNDGLALRRAQSVRRALLSAGLPTRRIEVASLGERRPLDFESTREAHDLNRRVEILIESKDAAADELPAIQRIAPACGSVASAVPTSQQ